MQALFEDRTIAPVPATERYGEAHDLFTLWFGGNVTMYVVVPWTAINLTDFYLVRRGVYDARQLLLRNGADGRFNLAGMGWYLAGIAIEVPFANTAIYEGPVARSLSGVDISWIVCLAVISPLYYLTARRARSVTSRSRITRIQHRCATFT